MNSTLFGLAAPSLFANHGKPGPETIQASIDEITAIVADGLERSEWAEKR